MMEKLLAKVVGEKIAVLVTLLLYALAGAVFAQAMIEVFG
jgi:hypothetical protein